MKLLPAICLLIANLPVAAQTYNFVWSPNPPANLVTNYVIRCIRPVDNALAASNHGVATNASVNLGPGTWECVLLAQNFTNISDPSDIVVVGQVVASPPGTVPDLAVRALWHAGAFDITATWHLSSGAISYNANLINLVTGTALTRTGANRSASWLRVPASTYRLTVAGINANGVQGPITTLEMGVTKPGKPKDFR